MGPEVAEHEVPEERLERRAAGHPGTVGEKLEGFRHGTDAPPPLDDSSHGVLRRSHVVRDSGGPSSGLTSERRGGGAKTTGDSVGRITGPIRLADVLAPA